MDQSLKVKRQRRARKRRRILVVKILLVMLVAAFLIAGGIFFLNRTVVAEELTREAGSALPVVSDFLEKENSDARVVSGLDDSVDMNTVADYEVVIEIAGKEYTSVLHVVDTVKPVVTAKDDCRSVPMRRWSRRI